MKEMGKKHQEEKVKDENDSYDSVKKKSSDK
jgi:hypothetical protein